LRHKKNHRHRQKDSQIPRGWSSLVCFEVPLDENCYRLPIFFFVLLHVYRKKRTKFKQKKYFFYTTEHGRVIKGSSIITFWTLWHEIKGKNSLCYCEKQLTVQCRAINSMLRWMKGKDRKCHSMRHFGIFQYEFSLLKHSFWLCLCCCVV